MRKMQYPKVLAQLKLSPKKIELVEEIVAESDMFKTKSHFYRLAIEEAIYNYLHNIKRSE